MSNITSVLYAEPDVSLGDGQFVSPDKVVDPDERANKYSSILNFRLRDRRMKSFLQPLQDVYPQYPKKHRVKSSTIHLQPSKLPVSLQMSPEPEQYPIY